MNAQDTATFIITLIKAVNAGLTNEQIIAGFCQSLGIDDMPAESKQMISEQADSLRDVLKA